jgi:hypothetical protein
MTEKELGRALLNLDMAPAPATPDPRQLTRKILERDRRGIRLLAALTTALWILAAAGVVWLVSFYLLQVTPRLRAYAAGRAQLQNDWNDWALAVDVAAQSMLACIITLLLAAVCTVFLILFSRRATLRQINASLVEISEQLKHLRQPPLSEKGATSGTA